jgi:hypothetical protein
MEGLVIGPAFSIHGKPFGNRRMNKLRQMRWPRTESNVGCKPGWVCNVRVSLAG